MFGQAATGLPLFVQAPLEATVNPPLRAIPLANARRRAAAVPVLVLTVEDNGTGFPEGTLDAGQALGLLGMCERVAMEVAKSLLETPSLPTLEIL